MAVIPEEKAPLSSEEVHSVNGQTSGSSSNDSVAQGLTSDWKWVNQKELQTLVTRAADASGVELTAKSSSSSSTVQDESAGTFVRVVTESGAESQGNLTSAGGSRQIAHILLTPSSSPPCIPDSKSKGKLEAGKKKTPVDECFDGVDLEKGPNPPVAAGDKHGSKGGVVSSETADEAVCRVCHFSLGPSKEPVVDLGCSCKHDLAHAHRECAETWFRVRGNRKCEICGEIAQNVHLSEATPGTSTGDTTTITVVTVHHRYACQNKPVRVLLAFLVAAFLVPWLFRFAYKQ